MIVKIYRERGKNKRSRGGEEERLTLTRIILHLHKKFRGAHQKRERNGKNGARTGQDQASPLFCPSWESSL
jgi:hypothetical protein